jgi:hypothetical protein
MKNRLPKFTTQRKICIICEGDEEIDYINKLINLQVWHQQYAITLHNVGGNGNITARYQSIYQNDTYDLVLIFYDTDKKPFDQYMDIKNKVNYFHRSSTAVNEVIIFGNPCTMQIILGHWSDVKLKSSVKK